jgi:hypothetical protein
LKTYNIRYRSSDRLKDFIYENQIVDSSDILIQIFTSSKEREFITDITSTLYDLLPHSNIIGTSTDGETIDGRVLTNSTIISISMFDHTSIKSLMIDDLKSNCFESGQNSAKELICDNTKAMIFFVSSNDIDAVEFLDGVRSVSQTVVAGGLSGDGGRFSGGVVFDKDIVSGNGVVGISLNSDHLIVGNSYRSDWEPVGKEFRVTKSHGCRVHTIDKMSGHELYKKYLGDNIAQKLPLIGLQFPFVLKDRDSGDMVVRSIRDNSDDGSLVFSAKIQEQESIQISFGDSDKMLKQTQDMIVNLANKQPIESHFIYASGGRRRFLKSASFAEIESFTNLGISCGFFGFGEFFANKDENKFLNQSITVLTLSESKLKKQKNISFKTNYKKIDSNLELTRALANIAQISSRELQELNQKLEMRVKEEVRKNRDKDSILIHNSKLAQMGEMMTMIAHQWRQPLSAISSTSTGLHIKIELGKYEDEFFLNSLEKIEDYVNHLSDTIDDFTNFFKPSKRKKFTTSKKLIEKALFILSSSFTKNSIEVETNFDSNEDFEVYANEVIQVLINLLKNSENVLRSREIKKPTITIKTYKKENKNYIEVNDNAGGIKEDIIDDIFSAYFSTNETQQSTGLGLYMSKFIIEDSCNGKIYVENSDDGAKFTVVL